MAIKKLRIPVTTTGSDGSATGTGTSEYPIHGHIECVMLDYAGSAPGTTDLTIAQVSELKATNIVTLTDNATDKVLYPRVQAHKNDGTALTLEGNEPLVTRYPVCDKLTVTVSGCNALDPAVTVEIYYESERGA